jgi:hypothetical protein
MHGQYSERLEEKEELLHCPICSRNIEDQTPYRVPHQQARYWIVTLILHLTAFKPQPTYNRAPTQSKPVDHNAHLIGTPLDSSLLPFS